MSIMEDNLSKFLHETTDKNRTKSIEVSYWVNVQRCYDNDSKHNSYLKSQDHSRMHPIRPIRGEVYVVDFGSSVGKEFCAPHLGLIVQSDSGNIYGDKTIVLPITDFDGQGSFKPRLHVKITNNDFESVKKNGLDKDPSKVLVADIMTIDKARLGNLVGQTNSDFMNEVRKTLKNILQI